MCERCKEIDLQIARYRRLSNAVNDKPTSVRFQAKITELESEKSALHLKPDR